ncbi:MAG: ferritin-like domain-containing protein [Acidobacteria bacterium]|nr:ferritin-like domain-containing protein [Acidobacteriota bacterium]
MTITETSPSRIIDIEGLSFTSGAHLLLKRALSDLPVGGRLGVRAAAPDFAVHLRGWCRAQGHEYLEGDDQIVAWVVRGSATQSRWQQTERAGWTDVRENDAVRAAPPANWGFAARGATVEQGGPAFHYSLQTKEQVWAEIAPKLYMQAVTSQWNPQTAINWEASFTLAEEVEQAVVQVMTYLIENENAALQVPARFIAQIHPHFREILQLLAIQIADEARHIEVFTRRAALRGRELGLSTVSGQQSLKTLLDEPDFALASFMLSVLGEGTFLNLLWFLEQHAPDPLTREIVRLVVQDEARHVAFGVGHLQYQLATDAALRDRLAQAITRRHEALAQTAGLNEEVFDALILLAGGSWQPQDIAAGYARVQMLKNEMHAGRKARLEKLGFDEAVAEELSGLHTRNFM